MTVNINGCDWNIKERHNNQAELCDGSFFGRIFYFKKNIFLNKNATPNQKYKTLVHDLTHAFRFEYLIDNQEKQTSYNDEELCEFMGHYAKQIVGIADKYFLGN